MTLDIALVLGILVVALVLFITEWVRMDLIALLVMGALAVTGLVGPAEALSGFSNPAVITVWAMFILSAGLTRAGVAATIGGRVLHWSGEGEVRMIVTVMLTAGVLSAIMNNIGVAALMLPVVLDVARRTGRAPSRLLMPLAYGSLLGGLTTLIGTPPNLLVSNALRDWGTTPFGMFDYTPVGGGVMLAGVLFVALVGRRWLPRGDPGREGRGGVAALREQYALDEQSVVMRLPQDSELAGRTLAESRLGSATGLNVFAVVRSGRSHPAPEPGFVLQDGDRLFVEGTLERLEQLRGWSELHVQEDHLTPEALVSDEVGLAEVRLPESSTLVGQTLREANLRKRLGVLVLAIRRDREVFQSGLTDTRLAAGDLLLVQGHRSDLGDLGRAPEVEIRPLVSPGELTEAYGLGGMIFTIPIPEGSFLVGKTLLESRLGDALGLGVFGVVRDGRRLLMPGPGGRLGAGDVLLVRGPSRDLDVFRGLQGLEIEGRPSVEEAFESTEAGLLEVMLAPRSSLPGKTLREIAFREKFGLRVLAILREGRVLRSNLGYEALRFGDALLLHGPPAKLALLAREADFLVLTRDVAPPPKTARAPHASLIMIAVLIPVLAGWLPISISAVSGAALMVLFGCLTMDEAYGAIEWRAVFLIAGMLPLGAALQETGAAGLLAEGIVTVARATGPWGVLISLYLITALATLIIPTAALVVLIAPIAHVVSLEMGLSIHAVMMALAMAASASFGSPVSHPANVLVMGPGGYRFVDYLKLGVPLALVVMVVTLLLLPIFWPL